MAMLPELIHTDPQVPGDEAIVPETVARGAYQESAPERTPETISNFDPSLLRVAYLAGFWYAKLFYFAYHDWLWADSLEPMGRVEHCFSESRAGIIELLAKLQALPLSQSGESALRELDRTREYIEDKWGGEDHERFVQRRDLSERELLSTKWEKHFSILRDPIWSDLKAAIAIFVDNLPAQFKLCWTTGSLVAQVNQLDDDDRQLALIGEECPIPILQERLIDLQREVPCLNGIDFEITKPRPDRIQFDSSDAIDKTRKAHNRILHRLQKAARSPLDSSYDETSSVSLDPGNQTCCVAIGNPDIYQVFVNNEAKTLTPARFDVIKALVNVFPDKLTKDQLVDKSGHADAVNMLKAIAKSDRDWKSVILLPGSPGKGYRLKGRSNG